MNEEVFQSRKERLELGNFMYEKKEMMFTDLVDRIQTSDKGPSLWLIKSLILKK